MKLSEQNIFPVKSLGGISLENCRVEERGLQNDRRWMLVNEKNEFLTQREFSKMAAIDIEIAENGLRVSHEADVIPIPFETDTENTISVKIWKSRCLGKAYGAKINEWFSNVLQTVCKLVLMPEETRRIVNPIYALKKFKDIVSFADGYPFMLVGENSLNDLNSKLEKALPMNRFRPNFVVSGAEAFAEDGWKKIKIGKTIFQIVKPCDRCVLTTINQESGERDGREPLKTLASYRTSKNKVLFGQYMIAENPGGIVKMGDDVKVLETKKSARATLQQSF